MDVAKSVKKSFRIDDETEQKLKALLEHQNLEQSEGFHPEWNESDLMRFLIRISYQRAVDGGLISPEDKS